MVYSGVAKKFNQYIVIQNQNIVLYQKNTYQVAWILNSDLNMAPLSEGIQAITRKPLLPSEQVQMRA